MRSSALKNSGSFTASSWALRLISTVVSTPGTRSSERLSPASSFFLAEKMSALRSVLGMDLLNPSRGALSCMPRVKSLPNAVGVDVAQHHHMHALGAGRGQHRFGRGHFAAQIQPHGVDLDDELVADAGAVRLQRAARHLRRGRVFHPGPFHRLGLRLRGANTRARPSGAAAKISVRLSIKIAKAAVPKWQGRAACQVPMALAMRLLN